MNVNLIDLIFFPVLSLLILICILGYGTFFNKYIYINKDKIGLKNLIFIQGLIFIGLVFIFINFFSPISDTLTIMTILLGTLLYIINFLKIKKIKLELYFLLFVLMFSFIFCFYAGISDDFNYHYETIKNFKNKNLYEILHHRTISYNSHWLFLTSIFSLSYLNSTLFILTALFFTISIYDLLKLSFQIIKNKNYYLSILSFFILIFFLGVLNNYKDFGTDIPGVIISMYILIIIYNYFYNKDFESINDDFLFLLLLGYFAFIIKITNVLVLLFLVFLFFRLSQKKKKYWMILLISFYPLPWIFQNYIISGCLIWPISMVCFTNKELAINETYLIESFAKGDNTTTMNVNNFDWIKIWFVNHFYKLLETYLIYFLILITPIIYFLLKKNNQMEITYNFFKKNYLDLNYKYFILILLVCNTIWFIYAPAYRFGIFYNLSLLITLVLPIWILILGNNYNFIIKYSKVVLLLIIFYFVYENINRIIWYNERYYVWPPIENGKMLERSKH